MKRPVKMGLIAAGILLLCVLALLPFSGLWEKETGPWEYHAWHRLLEEAAGKPYGKIEPGDLAHIWQVDAGRDALTLIDRDYATIAKVGVEAAEREYADLSAFEGLELLASVELLYVGDEGLVRDYAVLRVLPRLREIWHHTAYNAQTLEQISSLTGLEELSLGNYLDVDHSSLAEMGRLETLRFHTVVVTADTRFLHTLSALPLDLHRIKVESGNTAVLGHLDHVEEVILDIPPGVDTAGASRMTGLRSLTCRGGGDLSFLVGLPLLEELDAMQLEDVSRLTGLNRLRKLSVETEWEYDKTAPALALSPLVGNPLLAELRVRANGRELTGVLELAALEHLEFLSLTGSLGEGGMEELAACASLRRLHLDFEESDIPPLSPLQALTGLESLTLESGMRGFDNEEVYSLIEALPNLRAFSDDDVLNGRERVPWLAERGIHYTGYYA